jgi:putative chitinase
MSLIERASEDWDRILTLCGCQPREAISWSGVFAEYLAGDALNMGEEELDDFLGQVLHESGMLRATVENLNYSAEGLMRTWPSRFPDLATANQYARHPVEIANKVYGGRLGNCKPGDGWKYRGRGLIMVTGLDGYTHLGALMGLDLVDEPELLEQPEHALRAAILWWEGRVPDAFINDLVKVTRRVNGGDIGIKHRAQVTAAAAGALAVA